MDLGIGFISTNIMLPILDFFHEIVPSYGFAIIALTLVIRFAVYPLSAGSIRNMRRTRIAQPVMQKRVKEVQERYKDDPKKLQESMSEIYKEYGNPLAGCLPLLLQLPILWALFTTLRGSPFADINYTVDLQIFPSEATEQIQPQIFKTKPQNIYLNEDVHYRLAAVIPTGNRLTVGETIHPEFQSEEGTSFASLRQEYETSQVTPAWTVTKGEGNVEIAPDGTVTAIAPGEVTLQGTIPGLAANEGFLFINALGRVGAKGENGAIHWDIVGMVLFFGVSTYISQQLTGASGGSGPQNEQQQTISKITPILFTGMFLVFPLPAGVLMYMTVANVFQTAQTFILMREPLPENLQKLVEQQEKQEERDKGGRGDLPFEPKRSKKKEKASG
ncbi:membrane protein insertase YidC [Spirulina major CS-329]|uniref:membrane protein insertase YidC n=1 Tax=Spirulina TaxID=1154 RepID=UPI0009321159|nr:MULTISPECIES: membrane protein insertase YidC [Spirulina]MDB9493911.1 membrane protein insertase YidC [Spirulina subsalsa CS-330]MDB9504557.1 membrane protein insertase YidC [Spirulina major CS-329]